MHILPMTEIEWDIRHILGYKYCALAERVRISQFIKHIGITTR